MADEQLPLVVPEGRVYEPHDVAWLPGDEPEPGQEISRFPRIVRVDCEACGSSMNVDSLLSSVDDEDDEHFYCLDAEACRARAEWNARKAMLGNDYLQREMHRIIERVEVLEEWHRASGSAQVVAPAAGEVAMSPPAAGWHTYGATENGESWVTAPPIDSARLGEPGVTLVKADARAIPLEDNTVDLVVTSPPYWAQRSYTDGGGEHYRGQIGDEPTYDDFLDNLIDCTREWMRVLKPSGSIWVNLGDKYSTSSSGESRLGGDGSAARVAKASRGAVPQVPGMKPKSLLGLPWRYALRCVDELGLILREEVIWSKPNGMPESVTDRCRRSHEQWFHFTLNPAYYSAVDRIRLRDTPGSHKRGSKASVNPDRPGDTAKEVLPTSPLGALPPSVWEVSTAGLIVPEWLGVDHYAAFPMELPRRIILGFSPQDVCTVCGEGRRPYKSVEREGGRIRQKVDNRFLGKPKPEGMSPQSQDAIGAHAGYKTWHSIAGDVCACTPYTDHPGVRVGVEARSGDALVPGNTPRSLGAPAQGPWREYHLDDWEPPPTRCGVVLDPFGGTGTTALVASMHGRHGVHTDLSADYLRIAEWRTTDPAQRAAALEVPKPPVQMAGQLDMMDLFGGNG